MLKSEPYPYDTPFVAECRAKQSRYREEFLHIPLKPYIVQSRRSREFGKVYNLGNYISSGKESGANFLAGYIFNYAKERIRDRKSYETFDEDRLFNNLLSSQPMAFNLFYPLRKFCEEDQASATEAIRRALPGYDITDVTDVDLEFIPDNYQTLTGDKSAMDAIIRYRDSKGEECFIAIETKYSENLGNNTASFMMLSGEKYEVKRKKYFDTILKLNLFLPGIENKISDGKVKLTQLFRNFILSEAYGKWGKEENMISHSIVLAPAKHPSTKREIASLQKDLLPDAKEKIQAVTLEEFVEALIEECKGEYKEIFEAFKERYLNFKEI